MTEKEFTIFFKKTHGKFLLFAKQFAGFEFGKEAVSDAYVKTHELIRSGKFEIVNKDGGTLDYENFMIIAIRNTCLNELVRRKKDIKKHVGLFKQEDNFQKPDAELWIEEKEDREVKAIFFMELRELIEKLPPIRKSIFELWRNGKPYKQISKQHNITVDTARVQVKRAIENIRKWISEDYKRQQSEKRNKQKAEQLEKYWEFRNFEFDKALKKMGMLSEKIVRTHCKNGHELTKENTYRNGKNSFTCKICQKERMLKKYHAMNDALPKKIRPALPDRTALKTTNRKNDL